MTWLQIALVAWLAGHLLIPVVLYIGYGFGMAAKTSNDKGLSPPHVYRVDLTISTLVVLLDGLYNAFWLPLLCLDPRPSYALKMLEFKNFNLSFLELATERFSRYNEDPTEWAWRRWVARAVKPFLDGKDPKGWHIRPASATDAPLKEGS